LLLGTGYMWSLRATLPGCTSPLQFRQNATPLLATFTLAPFLVAGVSGIVSGYRPVFYAGLGLLFLVIGLPLGIRLRRRPQCPECGNRLLLPARWTFEGVRGLLCNGCGHEAYGAWFDASMGETARGRRTARQLVLTALRWLTLAGIFAAGATNLTRVFVKEHQAERPAIRDSSAEEAASWLRAASNSAIMRPPECTRIETAATLRDGPFQHLAADLHGRLGCPNSSAVDAVVQDASASGASE